MKGARILFSAALIIAACLFLAADSYASVSSTSPQWGDNTINAGEDLQVTATITTNGTPICTVGSIMTSVDWGVPPNDGWEVNQCDVVSIPCSTASYNFTATWAYSVYSATANYPGIGGPTNHRIRIQLYDDANCTEPDDFTAVTNPAPLTINQVQTDISVEKTSDAPNGVLPGANLTYTVTVTNTGPEALPNGAAMTVVDTLPGDVVYVSNNMGCTHDGSPTGGNVTCNLTFPTGLGVSSSTAFTITVNVASSQGTITNQVAITGRTLFIDPNSANDSATFDDLIIPTMTEWGMIIFVVLAGLGAVYYLRRQRKTAN